MNCSVTNCNNYNLFRCQRSNVPQFRSKRRLETVVADLNCKNNENLLFPAGISKFTMSQGSVGDCQLLAVIDALSRNKNGQILIKNMVKLNSDKKSIDVYLHCTNGTPVNISIEQLLEEREKDNKVKNLFTYKLYNSFESLAYRFSGYERFKHSPKELERPLGVQAIEHAYAKYLYEKYPDKFKSDSPKDVYDSINYHCSAQQTAQDLVGINTEYIVSADNLAPVSLKTNRAEVPHPALSSAPKSRIKNLINVLNDFSENPDKYFITACTSDTANKKRYIRWHEYSIRAYNKGSEIITITNPYHTEYEQKVHLSDFLNNFESVSYTQVGV